MDLANIRKKHKKSIRKADKSPEVIAKTTAVTPTHAPEQASKAAVQAALTGTSVAMPEVQSELAEMSEPVASDTAMTEQTAVHPGAPEISSADMSVIADAVLADSYAGDDELHEYLVFRLGAERFAVDINDVIEILKDQILTLVPRSMEFVVGVTSMGGKIIPVINPSIRLGVGLIDTSKANPKRKILILNGGKGPAGLIVEGLMEVIGVDGSQVLEPPAHLDERSKQFVGAVLNTAGGFVSVIRIDDFLDF